MKKLFLLAIVLVTLVACSPDALVEVDFDMQDDTDDTDYDDSPEIEDLTPVRGWVIAEYGEHEVSDTRETTSDFSTFYLLKGHIEESHNPDGEAYTIYLDEVYVYETGEEETIKYYDVTYGAGTEGISQDVSVRIPYVSEKIVWHGKIEDTYTSHADSIGYTLATLTKDEGEELYQYIISLNLGLYKGDKEIARNTPSEVFIGEEFNEETAADVNNYEVQLSSEVTLEEYSMTTQQFIGKEWAPEKCEEVSYEDNFLAHPEMCMYETGDTLVLNGDFFDAADFSDDALSINDESITWTSVEWFIAPADDFEEALESANFDTTGFASDADFESWLESYS